MIALQHQPKLPSELILKVASNLNKEDLINSSMVSKSYRTLLNTLLFRTIIVDNKNNRVSDIIDIDQNSKICSSQFREYIRSLEYVLYDPYDFDYRNKKGSSDCKDIFTLCDLCVNLKKISIICVETRGFPLQFSKEVRIENINELELISRAGVVTTNIDDRYHKYKKLLQLQDCVSDVILAQYGVPQNSIISKRLAKLNDLIPIDMKNIFPNLKILYLRGFEVDSNFINMMNSLDDLRKLILFDCHIKEQRFDVERPNYKHIKYINIKVGYSKENQRLKDDFYYHNESLFKCAFGSDVELL